MHTYFLGFILLGAPQFSVPGNSSIQFCGKPDRRTQVCIDSIDRSGEQIVRVLNGRNQSIQEFKVTCHLKLIWDSEVIVASVNTCAGEGDILKKRQWSRQTFKMVVYKSDYSSSGNRTWISIDGIRHERAFQLRLQ